MANKKLLFGIVGTIVLALAVVAGVFLIKQNQDLREKAAPASTISVTPSQQTKAPGDTVVYSATLDTNENSVTGVDIKINFDPNVLEVVSLQKGAGIANFDTIITNTFDNTAGTISYVIFTLDRTKAVQGAGVEALKINAKVKSTAANGTYNLTFDPTTSASASQEGQNVLIARNAGRIVVQAGGGASPTATSTSQPQPTATGVRTATPTATPIRTATPTGTGLRTATPTSTATSQAGVATATATATSTATSVAGVATATPTAFPIPETGTSLPTLLGAGLGIIILLVSVSFAL